MVSRIHKPEFGIFTNIFHRIIVKEKQKNSMNKEARPVLCSYWMKVRENLEIGIGEIMW